MKKLFVLFALSLVALSASAECQITSYADNVERTAFRKYGGWKFANFNEVCAKLQRARAHIQIVGMASVLDGKSIGWAAVSLIDAETAVGTTDFMSKSTKVHPYASQDKADELMVHAINDAVGTWTNLDKALEALDRERKKTAAAYAKK